MILTQICLINLLKGRHVGWNPFKLLSWLALNTIPKSDVKEYTFFSVQLMQCLNLFSVNIIKNTIQEMSDVAVLWIKHVVNVEMR